MVPSIPLLVIALSVFFETSTSIRLWDASRRVLNRRIRSHVTYGQDPSPSAIESDQRSASSSSSTSTTSNLEIQRLKQLVRNSKNKIVDFERGRYMDANDEAAQQLTTGPADNDTLQSYVQRNCTACLMREEAKMGRIERIKEDLLQKLGFKQAPNTTGKDAPPIVPNLQGILVKWGFNADNTLSSDAMPADEAYDARSMNRVDLRPEDYEAKTERVYAFATKPPIFLGLPDAVATDAVYFHFSPETMKNYVDQAHLHVHVNRPRNRTTTAADDTVTNMQIDVYMIDDLNGKTSIVDSKPFKRDVMSSGGHWEKIVVTKELRSWFQKPTRNYGMIVRVDYQGENLANMPVSGTIQGENQMYLDIVTKEGAKSRPKRSTVKLDCQEKDNETRCCRYPLVLDFESFGWDWVIAPKKYLAFYCSGECPFRHLQRYLHTHLVQQSNPRGNAGPCCYPTQMAPILMVYFNENKEVLVSKVPGMVVTRCGCA